MNTLPTSPQRTGCGSIAGVRRPRQLPQCRQASPVLKLRVERSWRGLTRSRSASMESVRDSATLQHCSSGSIDSRQTLSLGPLQFCPQRSAITGVAVVGRCGYKLNECPLKRICGARKRGRFTTIVWRREWRRLMPAIKNAGNASKSSTRRLPIRLAPTGQCESIVVYTTAQSASSDIRKRPWSFTPLST